MKLARDVFRLTAAIASLFLAGSAEATPIDFTGDTMYVDYLNDGFETPLSSVVAPGSLDLLYPFTLTIASNKITVTATGRDAMILNGMPSSVFVGLVVTDGSKNFGSSALIKETSANATVGSPSDFNFNLGGETLYLDLNGDVFKKGDSVTFSILAAPEPASWAMMIAGFGMIGGLMRRQRHAGAGDLARG
jgi:hypothetical protein